MLTKIILDFRDKHPKPALLILGVFPALTAGILERPYGQLIFLCGPLFITHHVDCLVRGKRFRRPYIEFMRFNLACG